MALFSYFEPDDAEAGVTMARFGAALTTWTAMQDRMVTVEEAALAFNVTPDTVVVAVELAPWIFIDRRDGRRFIEMEGE